MESKKLEEFNHWWLTGKVDPELALPFRRYIYNEIKEGLASRFILALTGLRRVGKSTIMYQLISDLLNDGIDATDILFFSFDEAQEHVSDVIDAYKNLQGKDFREKRVYVFLDEVQKCAGWENEVKKFYDLYPKMKFVLSGSESLFIRKRSKETLAGRIFEFALGTFTFKEYLAFNGIGEKEQKYETKVLPLFDKFIRSGGFPETFSFKSDRDFAEYIRALVVDKIVYRDVPRLFKINDPEFLNTLLELVASNPGMYVDYQSLSRQFGKDRRVIKNYFSYLEESFLIRMLGNYRKGSTTRLRKMKRAYPADNAITRLYKQGYIEPNFFGKMVETAVVNKMDAKAFWKNKREVDIVYEGKPIEVKYQESIAEEDFAALAEFMKKFKVGQAIMVTKHDEAEADVGGGVVKLIPAHKFMLW
ncbi:MAG: ATP-binding protein [Candidatus Micrarchaeaceae archaeon]